jgi:hypothetical protein
MKKLVLILVPVLIFAQTYVLKKDVLSAGGRKMTSLNYILNGTICQTTIGDVEDTDYEAVIGFWHPPEPFPPNAPYITQIDKSGNDVILYWHPITTDTLGNPEVLHYYAVYRNTTPDYIPGTPDLVGTTMVPDTTYTDPGSHIAGNSYYYLVKAVDVAANPSYPSNMGFKLNKFLEENVATTDMNWVSLAFNNYYGNASDISTEMSPNGTNLNMLTRLRPDQVYENWTYMFGMWLGDNFVIDRGIAYQFSAVKDTTTVLTGSHDPVFEVPLEENPAATDMNWVSVPYNAVYLDAEDITTEYSPAGNPLNMLTRLRPDQVYENWTYMFGMWLGDNFAVERGVGYQFSAVVDTTWLPSVYTNRFAGFTIGSQPYAGKAGKDKVYREPVWDEAALKKAADKLFTFKPNKRAEYSVIDIPEEEGMQSVAPITPPHLVYGYVPFENAKRVKNCFTFTAYCVDHPERALFENSVGCGSALRDGKWIVWAEFGNLPEAWEPGEEAMIIVESAQESGRVFGIKRFTLDGTENPQCIGKIELHDVPEVKVTEQLNSRPQISWQTCDKVADDIIVGYSVYDGESRVNEEIIKESRYEVAKKADYDVRPVFIGGYETVLSSGVMAASESSILPQHYTFGAITPNPFTKRVSMKYALPSRVSVKLVVFDITGRKVKTLVSGKQAPGYYAVSWDGVDDQGRQASAGVYFVNFDAGEFKAHKKVLLVK